MTSHATSPAISVVVPFFASEEHLEECLVSLLRAAEALDEPVELIFVDNVSPDGSAALIQHYLERDAEVQAEVRLLREETPGAYPARNAALRVAGASVIAFTDADCAVDPGWLASIREGMEDPEVGVLLGDVRYPPNASWALRRLAAYENAKTRYVLELPSSYHFAYANNMAVRASVFDEIGYFEEWQRAGDTEWVHRLAAQRPDLRVAFEPTMSVTHLEFRSARRRARRLSLYTTTNSKIPSFRELSTRQRLALLWRMLVG